MNLAIIIGISEYQNSPTLTACEHDALIMGNILEKLDKFDDTCLITKYSSAREAKDTIVDFVKRHEEDEVNEILFYFSGHGARYDDDFYYVFSDFEERRKESTGLKNEELDGLLRNLSPSLTVKIVDACYSGSVYIKSDLDITPLIKKSAKANDLDKIYFLHSSSSEETSVANKSYSFFTYSIFKSLITKLGAIRYTDIIAIVADDMLSRNLPQPNFVTQAKHLEEFGTINQDLVDYIKKELKLGAISESNPFKSEDENIQNKLISLVDDKSKNEYCSYEEAEANISTVLELIEDVSWTKEIQQLFDIEVKINENEFKVPNTESIGVWLEENSNLNIFAKPSYETKISLVEDYVEVPKKPSRALFPSLQTSYESFFSSNKEYELKKIERKRKVVNGFYYTANLPFNSLIIRFKPKKQAVENYQMTLIIVSSRKSLVFFSTQEVLPYIGWDNILSPKCTNWKVKIIPLKNLENIKDYTLTLVSNTEDFITRDILSKLEE